MPSDVGSQLVTNFANLAHEGLFGCVLTPIKPSPYTLFKFLSCTEGSNAFSGNANQASLRLKLFMITKVFHQGHFILMKTLMC